MPIIIIRHHQYWQAKSLNHLQRVGYFCFSLSAAGEGEGRFVIKD